MSKSEYRAEMAATGGYDPDGHILSIDRAFLNGIIKVLEDFTRTLEDMNKRIADELEEMKLRRARHSQKSCKRKPCAR